MAASGYIRCRALVLAAALIFPFPGSILDMHRMHHFPSQ
jgi:hypothetical protein